MKKIFALVILFSLISCSTSYTKTEKEVSSSASLNNDTLSSEQNISLWWDELNVPEWNVYNVSSMINDWKYEEAKNLLENDDKSNPEVLKLYWKIQSWEKKYEEALATMLKVNEMQEEKDYDTIYLIGVIYHNLWDVENAKLYINKSLELKPDFDLAKDYLNIIENNIVN